MKIGPIRYFCISFWAAAFSSGVRSKASSRVTPCGVTGGGRVGNGCRAALRSPGTSLCGTGRSSIGQTGWPVDAIEYEHEAMLRQLGDGFDAAPGDGEVHQHRLRGQRIVPDAMVDELVVPAADAGFRVQRDQRLGEQVVARTRAAVIEVAGIPGRQIDEAALLVDRHARPGLDLPGVAPRFVLPGLGADRGRRLRDRRPPPDQLAGSRVIGAHVSRRRLLVEQVVADRAAEDDEILVDRRRGVDLEVRRLDRPAQILAGIDRPFEPE